MDQASAIENPVWLENSHDPYSVPSLETLRHWRKIGKVRPCFFMRRGQIFLPKYFRTQTILVRKQKKKILDDEDKFCSSETLREVLDYKVKADFFGKTVLYTVKALY